MRKTLATSAIACMASGLVGQTGFGSQQVITFAANYARSVYATDLDGDGDADVLSASTVDNKIACYFNDGAGNFGPQQVITTGAIGARSVYAADLDGDGDMDVLSATSGDNKIACYFNYGGGNFGPQQVITNWANGARSVYAADMDGDGDMDVLSASNFDDAIRCYVNLGFGSSWQQKVITNAADSAWSVHATDLDNDGDMDVLSASSWDDKIACYFNDGAANFGPQQVITTAADAAFSVYAADLDGDGDMDVLSASGLDNKVAWYENSYTSPLTSTATPFGAGCGAPAMALTPFSTAITGQLTTGKVTNTPTSSCVIAGGTSNTNAPGLGALPFDLSIAGMTGCTLYQSAEVFGLPTVGAAVAGEAYFSLYIPSDPLLVGQHIYLQAFSIAPGANLLQVISSNGIDFLISNQ